MSSSPAIDSTSTNGTFASTEDDRMDERAVGDVNNEGGHQEEQDNAEEECHAHRNEQDNAEADHKFGPILSIGKAEHSTRNQTKSALAHFSTFLAGYWDRLSSLKDYSSHDRKQLYFLLEDKDLKEELIGSFCNYLSDADSKGKSRDGKIGWGTAQNYVSAVRNYFLNNPQLHPHLSKGKLKECFGDTSYLSKSRNSMRKAISNRSKESGIPLVQPKAGALRSDWIAIAAICVFCGSEDLAEFWALCVGLIHMASRGKNECTRGSISFIGSLYLTHYTLFHL